MKIRKIPFKYSTVDLKFFQRQTVSPVYQDLKINKMPKILIYEGNSILIEEVSRRSNQYTFFDYFDEFYQNTFLENKKTPFLICFCDGAFKNLDTLVYDSPVVEYLNNTGLHIYFWEMIQLGLDKPKVDHWPIKLKKGDDLIQIFNDNKSTIIGFENSKENQENMFCYDFDNVSKFVENNGLTNVTVFTGNYNIEKYFSKKYPNLKFKVHDIAVASMFHHTDKSTFTSYTYNPRLKPTSDKKIEYKFWCGNRRYSGQRNIIAAYLLYKSALVSFNLYSIDFLYKCPSLPEKFSFWNNINHKLWFDLDKWKTEHPKIYKTLKPGLDYIDKVKYLHIDRDMKDTSDFVDDTVPAHYYHSCFCAVVTETIFAQPCGHFAEKTLNAIKCFRPFVLVAPPHTLEYLKQCGVKTFDQWWDESYDQEENHEKRLIKILELIDYIDTKSIDELRNMYKEMLPILKHNYKIIESLRN